MLQPTEDADMDDDTEWWDGKIYQVWRNSKDDNPERNARCVLFQSLSCAHKQSRGKLVGLIICVCTYIHVYKITCILGQLLYATSVEGFLVKLDTKNSTLASYILDTFTSNYISHVGL